MSYNETLKNTREAIICNPIYTFKICIAECKSKKRSNDRCISGVKTKGISDCDYAKCGSRILVIVKPIISCPGYFISKDGLTVVSTQYKAFRLRRLDISSKYQTIIKLKDKDGIYGNKSIKSLLLESWGAEASKDYTRSLLESKN